MSLQRIEIDPFAVIAGQILLERKTGELTLIAKGSRRSLYFSQGELVLIASEIQEESLADFLVRRGVMTASGILELATAPAVEAAARFHESGMLDLSSRQTLLREWLASIFVPLFSLDEGTTVFSDSDALDPDKRVFLQSTAALLLEGIRSITNGLVLRRSLGDIKKEIGPARSGRFHIESIPLSDSERKIAAALTAPQTIESFLKQNSGDSVTAAKIVIGMLAIGIFEIVDRSRQSLASNDDMQRDLELLAAIGSSDQRSLRAVAFSRQIANFDYYQFLGVPRAATRSQIVLAGEELRRKYEPATFPPIIRDSIQAIIKHLEEVIETLKDPSRRATYDKLLNQAGGGEAMRLRVTQQSIAEQNFNRARELTVAGDYYGAIVLLRQTVQYAPDNAQAWFLLGSCQERNPNWRREAAESFQMALSVDPQFIDAMISLGDLYKLEGMISRAQSCWEDVLKISPDQQQAKSRLAALRKR